MSDIERSMAEIYGLREQLGSEIAGAIATGDTSKANVIRDKLDQKIAAVEKLIDPFEVRLRDQIGKEFGYRFVGAFSLEGIARAEKDSTKIYRDHFFIDRSGNPLFKESFRGGRDFVNGVAIVKKDDYESLLTKEGELIGPKSSSIRDFSEGFAVTFLDQDQEGYSCFFINAKGELIIGGFHDAKGFSEGVAWVRKDEGWIGLDKNFRYVTEYYINPEPFSEGLARVSKNNTGKPPNLKTVKFFIDKKYRQVLPKPGFLQNKKPFYRVAESFSEGLAYVLDEQGKRFIDHKGRTVIELEKSILDTGFFSGGLVRITDNELYNFYIDKSNQVRISEVAGKFLLDGNDFCEGFASVKTEDGWYFIKPDGSTLNGTPFDHAGTFKQGVAYVLTKAGEFYIDTKGRRVFG